MLDAYHQRKTPDKRLFSKKKGLKDVCAKYIVAVKMRWDDAKDTLMEVISEILETEQYKDRIPSPFKKWLDAYANFMYEPDEDIQELTNDYKDYTKNISKWAIPSKIMHICKTLDNNPKVKKYENLNGYHYAINVLLTNEQTGRIYIDDLDLGSYKLKHVIVSEGYIKNKEVYNFEIVNGNINIKESIYLEPLKSNITINKTYGNPIVGTSFYDKNVSFLIRNSKGDDVATIVTNEMGKANITLDYDNYRIIQITNNGIGNEYMREFRLNKSMFNRNHVYNIFTPIYEAKLKVKVYDLSTKLPMENIEFEIDGKTYFTDSDGIFITDNYKEGVYTLCETQIDGYYAIDDIIVEINDNSSYYIENDEIFIDVIVYNEKIKKKIENEEKDIIDDNNDKEEINDKIENKDGEELIDKPNKIENKNGEELIDKPNKIEKLPDLGIINHVNYLIFFLLGYKRVKKNNC